MASVSKFLSVISIQNLFAKLHHMTPHDDITVANGNPHMVKHNLLGVIFFCPGGQLPKVIHQGSHTWG